MNQRMSFIVLVLAALVASLGTSPQATAQQAAATTSAAAGATIAAAMSIVANPAALSFGSIVAGASTPGIVEQTAAASPARNGTGLRLGSAATVSAATFRVTGDGSATYSVMLPSAPATATCASPIGAMTVTLCNSLPSDTGLLNAGRAQTIYVGGTLHVAKGQIPGVYTGTFDVTVAYD